MKVGVLGVAILMLAGCRQNGSAKVKMYPLTGKIISVDIKEHTATIDAAAIPNYMGAMKMDYPIASDADLAALKVGESIRATIAVSDDGSYKLQDIHDAAK